MGEFFRDLGFLLALTLLGAGSYLIYDTISNAHSDPGAGLLLGAAMCSFGLVTALLAVRTAFLIRNWKRHLRHQ